MKTLKTKASVSKGQAMVDVLMIAVVFSFVFTLFAVSSDSSSLRAQSLRYETQQNQLAMLSALKDSVNISLSDGSEINGRLIDILAMLDCGGTTCQKNGICDSSKQLLNATLKSLNQGKHFIFYANVTAAGDDYRVYDNESCVYLEDVSVATFAYKTACGESVDVIYGSWFDWQKPRAC
ncbi:MAG: hypothetical protein V1911_02200 [Candidatus Micrarchaeota archaeon]